MEFVTLFTKDEKVQGFFSNEKMKEITFFFFLTNTKKKEIFKLFFICQNHFKNVDVFPNKFEVSEQKLRLNKIRIFCLCHSQHNI
jgi:hypothetical protein